MPLSIRSWLPKSRQRRRGSVTVEYILLLTLVGIGVIAGLACLRTSLVNELQDLADAITAISLL